MRTIFNPFFGLLVNGLALGWDIECALHFAGGALSWLFSGLAGINGACLLMFLVWFVIDALCPSYEVEIQLRDPAHGDYERGAHGSHGSHGAKNDIVDL